MLGARSYRIIELLGRGSYGAVYLADTLGTGIRRPVAIKVLRPEQASIPGLIERLRDEARMLSMIRHRAIVRVDDLVELDGHWSVVMEYIEGCDIAALLVDGPFPPRVALAIAEEVANALHVAATQEGPDGRPLRLVHRDVKPGNIRMTAQGEVKLLDFGVARADFSARESSGTTGVFGTPTYMAPERYRGEDSHAGDVYALGVTLFEMLAGEPPGQGPMEPERVPPGIRLAPAWRQIRETSGPLRDLICAMLAPDPTDRPPARECARALARVRGQIGGMTLEDWAERVVPVALKARRTGEDGRVGTMLSERSSQASLRVAAPPTGGGKTALLAAMGSVVVVGGVVALLAVVAGAWWWTSRSATEDPGSNPPIAATPSAAAPSSPTSAPPPSATTPEPVPAAASAPVAEHAPVAATVAAPAAPRRSQAQPSAAASPPPATRPVAASSSAGASGTSATAGTNTRSASPAAAAAPIPPHRATPSTGIVALEGHGESVILMGKAGVYGAGELPVGDYTAEVTLASGEMVTVTNVTVTPEGVTRLTCAETTCREIEER